MKERLRDSLEFFRFINHQDSRESSIYVDHSNAPWMYFFRALVYDTYHEEVDRCT